MKSLLLKKIAALIFCAILCGCSSLSVESVVEKQAKRAALRAASPVLEKIFLAEGPIAPASRELYPTTVELPCEKFSPEKHFKKRISITKEGNLSLSSGDYIIPVMTYCMRSSGSSPDGHRYTLGRLTGKMADVISSLNRRAIEK